MTQPANPDAAPGHVHDFRGHRALNLHLLSEHADGGALGLRPEEAEEAHHHEHFGPGGIRNHPFESRQFDPAKATVVINECAEMLGDDLTAGVQRLLARPVQTYYTQPGAHTHEPPNAQQPTPTVCLVDQCPAYPRWVDVQSRRDANGVFLTASSMKIDTYSHRVAGRGRPALAGWGMPVRGNRGRPVGALVHTRVR